MAQITVKYDPSLKIEEIQEPMYATSPEESPEDTPSEIQQTKVTGIITPLIKINNIEILWPQIKSFRLQSEGFLPELNFSFDDTFGFIKSLQNPGNDNLILIQILPPFENAYKKINMRFFIDDLNIRGTHVTVSAIYNVPKLYQNRIQSFGNISTYDYADKVAKDCELGLAANIDGTDDKHYIFASNEDYVQSFTKELTFSGTDNCILDSWIDFHNYLILCDVYERYNAIDKDLKVWTSCTTSPDTEDGANIQSRQEDAILTNASSMRNTQLAIEDYSVSSGTGENKRRGTDRVLESYFIKNSESSSTLIQNGDVKKDTFVRSQYCGEVFGDRDYFLMRSCRNLFLQKMKRSGSSIKVKLHQPMLGLERGQRVDVRWYDGDRFVKDIKETKDISSNIPTDDEDEPVSDDETMTLNKQISGQYLIIAVSVEYKQGSSWSYVLTLVRPDDQVKDYLSNADS